MNPDRFRTAFKIRFKWLLTFGANFVCKCGFKCRDESDTHPLNALATGATMQILQFVKSLARGAGFYAPKGDVCLRETAPGVTGLLADGIILLADEDCSKALLIDIFGCEPTLASSSNILFDNVFAANITTKNAKSTPVVPLSCPLDSLSLAASVRNSVLYSADSLELFSNESKIPSADSFPVSESIISTCGLRCVYLCLLHVSQRLD
jgi:hypothetical protein